ncbi:MAG: hypothetical protein HKN58_09170 [Xanthomonadales bacterium]|nr:hypothetical protein [Xanthomonadales bacterium]
MSVQIIAWMASGFYFALFPIETIRGEHLVLEEQAIVPTDLEGLIAPDEAWAVVVASLGGAPTPSGVSVVARLGQTWYQVSGDSNGESFTRMVNARTGEVLPFLDADQVAAIAAARLAVPATGAHIELVTEARAGSEYRGRTLPLWRVSFSEPESLRLYIDGWTGDIVAQRTARWRIFDFLWMLHIMDFDERDDFNTGLLQVAAALGLVIALSGLVYWAMSTRLFRRRRHGVSR